MRYPQRRCRNTSSSFSVKQCFLQGRWLRYRLFQYGAYSLITLQYFFCLRFGMVEIISPFNRFNFILQLIVQGKRFVIDEVMNGFVIAQFGKQCLYAANGGRGQRFVIDKIANGRFV